MRSGADRSLSRCSPRSLSSSLDELGSSRPRRAPARRGRRRRCGQHGGRRRRRTPPRSSSGVPVCRPTRTLDRAGGERLGEGRAAAIAPGAVGKGRRRRRPACRPRPALGGARLANHTAMLGKRLGVALAPSSCSNRVEPSTSVKRKVTVPEGRSCRIGRIMRAPRLRMCTRSVSRRVGGSGTLARPHGDEEVEMAADEVAPARAVWRLGDYHRFAREQMWEVGPVVVAACGISPVGASST